LNECPRKLQIVFKIVLRLCIDDVLSPQEQVSKAIASCCFLEGTFKNKRQTMDTLLIT